MKLYSIVQTSTAIGLMTLLITSLLSVGGAAIAIEVDGNQPLSVSSSTKQNQTGPRLPSAVAQAVQRNLSRRLNVPRRQLTIVNYSREQWTDGCLGLSAPEEICSQALVNGWLVMVEYQNQTWIYRTDNRGRQVRLQQQGNNLSNLELPDAVFQAVVDDAQQRSNLPTTRIQVIWAEQQQWNDSCLELMPPQRDCTAVITPGWLVGVDVDQRIWIYRTDATGSTLYKERDGNNGQSLPPTVSQSVLRDARRRLSRQASIIQFEQRQWSDGCLGLREPGEFCTDALVIGWWILVEDNNRQRLTYHTDGTGRQLRIDNPERSSIRSPLP